MHNQRHNQGYNQRHNQRHNGRHNQIQKGRVLFEDASFHIQEGEKIGIIGMNGSGKSTLLKMIIGEVSPDAGTIEIGEIIKIGYFAQDNVHMDENMKAIEYVWEVAEYIQINDGKITASALMERFLFDGTMQWSKIRKLSGGERRRLYLLRILMTAPNVLLFDVNCSILFRCVYRVLCNRKSVDMNWIHKNIEKMCIA